MRVVKYLRTWTPLARIGRLITLLPNLALTISLRLLFDKIFWTRGSLTPSYRVASHCFSFLDLTPLQWRNSLSITLSNCDIFKTSLARKHSTFFSLIFLTLKYFLVFLVSLSPNADTSRFLSSCPCQNWNIKRSFAQTKNSFIKALFAFYSFFLLNLSQNWLKKVKAGGRETSWCLLISKLDCFISNFEFEIVLTISWLNTPSMVIPIVRPHPALLLGKQRFERADA